jgi:hypothetical protein
MAVWREKNRISTAILARGISCQPKRRAWDAARWLTDANTASALR